ncbi:hypothetical protein KAJ77_01745 [bacterium]|nr:hypothetical protein [bacterium]
MTDHSKLLPRLLEKLFPLEEERELVVEILGQYGSGDFQREGDRVRMAILKLAGRSPEQIRYYTLMACRDYRDVLAGAEYPNQMGHYPWREKDPERLAQIQAEDKEQYQSWYLGILWEGKSRES